MRKKKQLFSEELYDFVDDCKNIIVQRDIYISDTKLDNTFWKELSNSINKALDGLSYVTVESSYLGIKRESLKSKPKVTATVEIIGTRKMTDAEKEERSMRDEGQTERKYIRAKNELHQILGEFPQLRKEL